MIATGGLLRINARRQDSLRSKPRVKPKKKIRKKRRHEVVVVRGKLQLCSLSGLMAVLGLLVLLVGGIMAAVGYCPQDALPFGRRPQESAANGSTLTQAQLDEGLNSTQNNSTLSLVLFLQQFLDSDRLKVLGPLVMGIGIFLFLCANAVLHENRDKLTKVIKLRDIYSTVIDLHQNQDRDQNRDQNRQNHSLEDGIKLERWDENGKVGMNTQHQHEDQGQNPGFLTKWRTRKGSSVKERKEEMREQEDERVDNEEMGRNGESKAQNGGHQSVLTKWRMRKGGSVKERPEGRREGCVFSVFHEHRFSLPSGFSFYRAASDKRCRRTTEVELKISVTKEEAKSKKQEEVESREQLEAESKELDTANTSFYLIGSQRPLLMMSCSSLSPAYTVVSANQRRSSLLGYAHCMSSANRRSSCI